MIHLSLSSCSIIVPTYREAAALPAFINRIAKVMAFMPLSELIIVDDASDDGTPEMILEWSKQYAWIRLIERKGEKSLGLSVVQGIEAAQYASIVIMDVDLSHPPEAIPEMLIALQQPGIDMVIGSRYVAGGSIDVAWSWKRKWASKMAAWFACAVLLKKINDPLSGFLAIRRERCFAGGLLQPVGWKISLELIVKCHCLGIKEVPIHFAERQHGASKMRMTVILAYLEHLYRLSIYRMRKT